MVLLLLPFNYTVEFLWNLCFLQYIQFYKVSEEALQGLSSLSIAILKYHSDAEYTLTILFMKQNLPTSTV